MKCIMQCALAFCFFFPSSANGEDAKADENSWNAGWKLTSDYSLKDPFAPKELREAKNVDLALSGYDYMLNKSEPALDHILAQFATEDIGADVDTVVVMSTLDEWNRSIRTFHKHFVHTDGAGGSCMVGFKATRAYLYPKEYEKMREAIEASMDWTAPLLP